MKGKIKRVLTENGPIACETVVIAAGIWSRAIGALMGVEIPAAALEHQYVVTEPMKERDPKLPTLRDPDNNFYLKPEVGGFAVGGWEMGTPPFHPEGVPFDFARELLPAEHGALRGNRPRRREAHPGVRRARPQAAHQRSDSGVARR